MSSSSSLSSFDRVPPEILGLIFLECQPSGNSLDTKRFPWVLGQVCSWWRAIALSEPRLWRVFSAMLNDKTDTEKASNLATLYFARSGKQLLHVRLERPYYARRSGSPLERHAILDVCASVAKRWQDVQLIKLPSLLLCCLPHQDGPLASLRYLSLDIYPSYEHDLNSSFAFFQSAPALKRVAFIGTIYVIFPRVVTEFISTNNSPATILTLLQRSERLKKFYFLARMPGNPVDADSPSIALQELEVLELFDVPGRWFEGLSAPSLVHLKLSYRILEQEGFLYLRLLPFLQRSGCRIQRLAIETRFYTIKSNILHLLEATPDLEELRISGDHVESDVLDGIQRRRDPHAIQLIPKLKYIRVIGQFDAENFYTMVESRAPGCDVDLDAGCLSLVEFTDTESMSVDDGLRRRWDILRSAGLKVTSVYPLE